MANLNHLITRRVPSCRLVWWRLTEEDHRAGAKAVRDCESNRWYPGCSHPVTKLVKSHCWDVHLPIFLDGLVSNWLNPKAYLARCMSSKPMWHDLCLNATRASFSAISQVLLTTSQTTKWGGFWLHHETCDMRFACFLIFVASSKIAFEIQQCRMARFFGRNLDSRGSTVNCFTYQAEGREASLFSRINHDHCLLGIVLFRPSA